ncbi:MAG: DUF1559 domain-containing protein [Planctomycetaceae bacterium]|nr:DUF1559 domain-containing protein [Planctomycetaceae bacterium]
MQNWHNIDYWNWRVAKDSPRTSNRHSQTQWISPFRTAVWTWQTATRDNLVITTVLNNANAGWQGGLLLTDTSSIGATTDDGDVVSNRAAPWMTGFGPRDDFSWWSDGTSNQIALSEKHIPSWAVGAETPIRRLSGANSTIENAAAFWDAGIINIASAHGNWLLVTPYVSGANQNSPVARTPYVARGPNEPGTGKPAAAGAVTNAMVSGADAGKYSLGSAHTSVFNVLIGDGSVRGLPVTISDGTVLALARVNDGVAVALP